MNIKKFANAMQGSGVKPSLFEVEGNIGTTNTGNDNLPFLIKSASLPGQSIGVIEIPYRGRRIKIPGDRSFADWTITVINDSKMDIRRRFELWINSIQGMESNIAVANFSGSSIFGGPMYADWTINQLDRQGKPIKAYKLIGCFPVDISAIDVSYEATDQIEEFTVTLAYSYFGTNDSTPDVSTPPGLVPLTPK